MTHNARVAKEGAKTAAHLEGWETANRVALWLGSLPQVTETQAARVTIGRETFNGAHYVESLVAPETARNPGPYKSEALYLVGPLPASYRKRSRTVYRFEGDAREWYVAGYADARAMAPQFAKFHPFGVAFYLRPWDVPGGESIDAGEWYAGKPVTYTRVNAKRETAKPVTAEESAAVVAGLLGSKAEG